MKIKIIKCSSTHYWYLNRIGETFEVLYESLAYGYCVHKGRLLDSFVSFSDAEVLSEAERN